MKYGLKKGPERSVKSIRIVMSLHLQTNGINEMLYQLLQAALIDPFPNVHMEPLYVKST